MLRRLRTTSHRSATGPPADESPVVMVTAGGESRLAGRVVDGRLFVATTDFERLSGWRLDAESVTDGSSTVPLPEPHTAVTRQGLADVGRLAGSPEIPVAVDRGKDTWIVATARLAGEVARRLEAGEVSDVAMPDLSGRSRSLLELLQGRTVLVALSSWCACHLDLPVWQAMAHRLAVHDISFVVVAVENDLDHARQWAADTDLPVVVDLDRQFCEHHGVVTVPTVLWVDEHQSIIRPNDQVFADNTLQVHHGLDCRPHHEELHRWGSTGDRPPAAPTPMPPTPGEQRARCEYRVAVRLWNQGLEDRARVHLDRAAQLAPEDLTIRRAALQLLGGDPLGEDFLPLYRDWQERTGGRAYRHRP